MLPLLTPAQLGVLGESHQPSSSLVLQKGSQGTLKAHMTITITYGMGGFGVTSTRESEWQSLQFMLPFSQRCASTSEQ